MSDDFLIDDLRRLQPAGPLLDAVVLAYVAGRRSARTGTLRWRSVAVVAVVAAILPWSFPRRDVPLHKPTPMAARPPAPEVAVSVVSQLVTDGPTVAMLSRQLLDGDTNRRPAVRTTAFETPLHAGDFPTGGGL